MNNKQYTQTSKKGTESIQTGLWTKNLFDFCLHPKKILNKILHICARSSVITPRLRCRLHQLRGVRFSNVRTVFIGTNVVFDELFPELISIGKNVKITEGVKILTHYYDPSFNEHSFYSGSVCIEDDVFIGMGAVIGAPLTIGNGAVIGANSVLSNDVPSNSIVAGNPAQVIGQRGDKLPTNKSAVHR